MARATTSGDGGFGSGLRPRESGTERFVLMAGAGTSHAFVSVDENREPTFAFYGDDERPAAHADGDLDPALAGEPGVLVVGSDTLLGKAEREVTMRAAELGRERGWRVLCDPNVRPRRWDDKDEMLRVIRALAAAATVVKCNEGEVRALTGEGDLEAVAEALRELGPAAVVVTLGSRGALVVSESGAQAVKGVEAEVVDATGAGDSVAGVITAGLAAGADPAELAPVVEVAMHAAAAVVGAVGRDHRPAARRRGASATHRRPPVNVPHCARCTPTRDFRASGRARARRRWPGRPPGSRPPAMPRARW